MSCKKAIVYGFTLADAEIMYKKWCQENNIRCRISDAVLLSAQMSLGWISDHIRGYYKDVEEGNIKLIGLDKLQFFDWVEGNLPIGASSNYYEKLASKRKSSQH